MSNPLNSVGKALTRRAHKIGPKANDNDNGGSKADGDGKKGGRGLLKFFWEYSLSLVNIYQEFSQRNIQLEHEKAEIQNDLHKKMAEIVEMHKEMEEKSEELAKKAKQIDTLLIQLNESTRF
jgi:hypothetical protein